MTELPELVVKKTDTGHCWHLLPEDTFSEYGDKQTDKFKMFVCCLCGSRMNAYCTAESLPIPEGHGEFCPVEKSDTYTWRYLLGQYVSPECPRREKK